MFLGVLNKAFLNISKYLPHLELKKSFHSNCPFNEFCRYIECRYKEV